MIYTSTHTLTQIRGPINVSATRWSVRSDKTGELNVIKGKGTGWVWLDVFWDCLQNYKDNIYQEYHTINEGAVNEIIRRKSSYSTHLQGEKKRAQYTTLVWSARQCGINIFLICENVFDGPSNYIHLEIISTLSVLIIAKTCRSTWISCTRGANFLYGFQSWMSYFRRQVIPSTK